MKKDIFKLVLAISIFVGLIIFAESCTTSKYPYVTHNK